jgi:hypothetical protein
MLINVEPLDPTEVERALRAVRELMAEAYREKKRMNGGELEHALRVANAALKFWHRVDDDGNVRAL